MFRFGSGKLWKVLDESLQRFNELQQMRQQIPNMEFGRRLAVDRDLEKSSSFKHCNLGMQVSLSRLIHCRLEEGEGWGGGSEQLSW